MISQTYRMDRHTALRLFQVLLSTWMVLPGTGCVKGPGSQGACVTTTSCVQRHDCAEQYTCEQDTIDAACATYELTGACGGKPCSLMAVSTFHTARQCADVGFAYDCSEVQGLDYTTNGSCDRTIPPAH